MFSYESQYLGSFWTSVQWLGILRVAMRRTLHIRTAFESTRLGDEHLQHAYEMLVPVSRRRIRRPVAESVDAGNNKQSPDLQQQKVRRGR